MDDFPQKKQPSIKFMGVLCPPYYGGTPTILNLLNLSRFFSSRNIWDLMGWWSSIATEWTDQWMDRATGRKNDSWLLTFLISLKNIMKLLGMKGLKGSQSAVEVAETVWSCVTHGFFVHLQMHGFSSCTSWCSFCTCSCHVLEFKRLKRTQLALQILAFINHNWLVVSNMFYFPWYNIYIYYIYMGYSFPLTKSYFSGWLLHQPDFLIMTSWQHS